MNERTDTKSKILDAAEKLFGSKGSIPLHSATSPPKHR